jgi:hypothetical protein
MATNLAGQIEKMHPRITTGKGRSKILKKIPKCQCQQRIFVIPVDEGISPYLKPTK